MSVVVKDDPRDAELLGEDDLAPPEMKGRTTSKVVGKPLLYGVSVFASIGVWLFGYDQGVMSGIITGPYFKAYFNQPTSAEVGMMVSLLEVGAFVTSLLAAPLADSKGRRPTLLFGAILFTIGGLIQTITNGYTMMCIGRIISGSGVGMLSMIVPVYQSEISPADHRGALACVEFTGNIIGYSCSIWIDYACSYFTSDLSWRIPLSIQCIGGIILAAGSLLIPESPRFLIQDGQDEEGLKVIADFHDGNLDDPISKAEFMEIKQAVLLEQMVNDRSYTALWKRYSGRVLIAMSSQALAQMNGINVISYYAPLVFEQAGWIGREAIFATGINSFFYMASSIIPWFLVDRTGRRIILMVGAVAMAIMLSLTGFWIYIDLPFSPKAVVICVIIYNAAFGFSWGPVPWLYGPEIMPLPFRAKGVSLSTATNWAFNFYVGLTTPILQDLIGWRLYILHAGSCVLSLVVVYFLYPETAGVPLEEMDALFGEENSDEKDVQEDDEDDEEDDGSDGPDDDDTSTYASSGTSRRSRKNSSTPLMGAPGPIRRMSTKMGSMFGRKVDRGSAADPGYGPIGQ